MLFKISYMRNFIKDPSLMTSTLRHAEYARIFP